MIDQTHGGWIPPHEPSASCRSRIHRSATCELRGGGARSAAAAAASGPGLAPIAVRSTSDGRTGRSDCATASATNVCRAQQEKS